MKRLLYLFQFLPLGIFVSIARSRGFAPDSWSSAFQVGALAGTLQLILLIPIMGNRLNRLIAGANAFLIFGGVAFYFESSTLLGLINSLRAAAVIFFVGLVCLISTVFAKSGVFERRLSKKGLEKRYSVYFLAGIAVTFTWSLIYRGDTTQGGIIPFVFLILLKLILQRHLSSV